MLIEIDRLTIAADAGGTAPLVSGISLGIERGEIVGVIGESGSGKTTLGLAALGYVRPGCRVVEGRVLLDGRDLLAMDEREVRRLRGQRIAYLAQSASATFNPVHRLGRQICEPAVRNGLMSADQAKRKCRELIGRLLLPDPDEFAGRYPHEVSGGQLQRAMAAMAMICNPDFLVLDEPTTALDVTTQIEFLAIMRDLIRETGVAGLYITHDLALVAQISHRIMVLRRGVVEEEGATRDIIERPRSTYAKALLDARRVGAQATGSAETSENALLRVRNVTVEFGRVRALDDVTVGVSKGETLAIVGESGSGKSTLARVVMGLTRQKSGTVEYEGTPISDLPHRSRELRRSIQLVHQHPDLALNPKATLADIIGRPLKVFFGAGRAERRMRVAELLRLVGLGESYAGRYPSQLSGGEKQRVCIARALAAKPSLLVCDEVTASLDALIAKEILALLVKLRIESGMACIVITHDFGVVEALADRVVVMLAGRIVEQGSRERVIGHPSADYTQRLLASVPDMRVDWLDQVLERRQLPRTAAAD